MSACTASTTDFPAFPVFPAETLVVQPERTRKGLGVRREQTAIMTVYYYSYFRWQAKSAAGLASGSSRPWHLSGGGARRVESSRRSGCLGGFIVMLRRTFAGA